MPNTVTTEVLIRRANEIHKNKYDYSRVPEGPLKMKIKVEIICPIDGHGIFSKNFNKHNNGKEGCPKCALISSYRKQVANFEDVKKKANEIHNNKFDYSKFKYVNGQTKSTIICPHHGEFQQSMGNHTNKLFSRGCKKCSDKVRGDRTRLSLDQVIKRCKEIHGNKYDYSNYLYKNNLTKSTIICPHHGEFEQRMADHWSGQGCTVCGRNNVSEGILKDILSDNFNYEIIHDRSFEWCSNNTKPKRYDFIIEDLKCIIELDGIQHFTQVSNWQSPEEGLKNDIFKNERAMANGYSMIRVYQPDIYNNKKDIILKLIMSIHRYKTPQLICIGECYQNRFN